METFLFGAYASSSSSSEDSIVMDPEIVDLLAVNCYVRLLRQIRPQLAICGNVPEGCGTHPVLRDSASPNVRHKENGTGYSTDPEAGNMKQSYVDLSLRD